MQSSTTKGRPSRWLREPALVSLLHLLAATAVLAQYPRIADDVRQRSDAASIAEKKHARESWSETLPVVREWESKGKPYRPWAAAPEDLPQARIPAFPGAWGGGMFSFGGRGGRVFVVTSLNDSGPGTLREALEAGGPRIVLFNVAGIIRLKSPIHVRAPYLTLSGATAPGDGVCVAGATVAIDTHDVIIRHMRFRRGETWVGSRDDSLGGNPVGNIMIDHVSASWGLDECMSMYRHMEPDPKGGVDLKLPTVNITIQNSIFSEALNTYNHAFGSTIGGLNSTFHHNLWASNGGRNPSVGMWGDFTLANNVVFNWVHRTTDGGDHRSFYNIINNYYKPGPATPRDHPVAHRILKPETGRTDDGSRAFGKAYVDGNLVEGTERVSRDNWDGGVQPDLSEAGDRRLGETLASIRSDTPFPHAQLPLEPADKAYQRALANAGATLPRRDAVDERVIESVRTGKVTAIRSPGDEGLQDVAKFPTELVARIQSQVPLGIITTPSQVGGYPEYRGEPYPDTDGDGMPDAWESKHGLDPHDPSDASADSNGDGYTAIEEFIHGLDPDAPAVDWTDLKNNIDHRDKVEK